jgi:hypothetical protein
MLMLTMGLKIVLFLLNLLLTPIELFHEFHINPTH